MRHFSLLLLTCLSLSFFSCEEERREERLEDKLEEKADKAEGKVDSLEREAEKVD